MLSKSFKAGKCKTSLKLAVARIKLLKNKREVQVKQMRRDLAQLLEAGQDQTARIRVEHVIREEKTKSAYDLIELYCELIVARLAIIESQKNCPIDLKEAITSVIFASPRCADIPELLDVRKHFAAKYGKEFSTSALELRPDCGVNRLIVEKLSAKAPDTETKIKVLTAIAQEHSIKWDPKAFEEQVQKPPEDLLKGPSSFTNKMPMESSTVQFPPAGEKLKSATKPNREGIHKSSSGSNSFSLPTVVETASQPQRRAPGSTYDGGESRDTYSREEAVSMNRQKWNVEFKDATSAAQAAAESAERASIAARAAAELASRGNDPEYSYRSHEPSIYGSKREAGNSMGLKLQGESPTRDSRKRDYRIDEAAYVTNRRMQNRLEAEDVENHFTGDFKSVEESETTVSRNSRIASPSMGGSSEKDAIEVNQQRKKIEDDSSDEESAERHPIRPVSSYSSYGSYDGVASVSNLQKSDSYRPESYKADPVGQNLSERTGIADAEQGGIERKPSKSLSSHTSVSSIDHETIWDSPLHKNYVNPDSPVGTGREIDQGDHRLGFKDDVSVVFDRYDSQKDDHSEIDNFMEKHDIDSTSQLSEANFRKTPSYMESSALDQQNSFHVKDGSHSLLHCVSRVPPAEFSGTVRADNTQSQSDAVVYDHSDGASSDSEDEMDEFTGRGDTVLNSLQDRQNVDKYEHLQSLSRSSLKGTETMDRLDRPSSSFTDADTKAHSGYTGGRELNFGRLTGGLRNKGYLHPPYMKSPVVDGSLPSETSADVSPKKPMASPKDKTAKIEDASKNVNNWKTNFETNEESVSRYQTSIDSDNIEVSNLEQRRPSGSSGYHGFDSHSSTSKLDDNFDIDYKQKVSSTFIRPESKELDREISYQKSIGVTSKESRRTSAAVYFGKDTEKQPLSPAHLQHAGGASASIQSNQKADDTETVVSNIQKVDIYDKKSSVRTHKGLISPSVPFSDEENDEDEGLPPRHTAGNLGIKGGRRVSQRTRGSKVDQVSNFRSSSHDSSRDLRGPELENKSIESVHSVSESPSKPSTSSVKPETNKTSKFLPPNLSIKQHPAQLSETEVLAQKGDLSTFSVSETPSKPSTSSDKLEKNRTSKFSPPKLSTGLPAQLSGTEILVQKDGLEPSESSLSRNNNPASNENMKPSKSVERLKVETARGDNNTQSPRESSLKSTHVHPKLPDYETFADYFKTLRSNRR